MVRVIGCAVGRSGDFVCVDHGVESNFDEDAAFDGFLDSQRRKARRELRQSLLPSRRDKTPKPFTGGKSL